MTVRGETITILLPEFSVSAVIRASRIAAQAGTAEILMPEPLRHLLSGKGYVDANRRDTSASPS